MVIDEEPFPCTMPVGRVRASVEVGEMGNPVTVPGDLDNPEPVLVFAWWVSSSGEIEVGTHQERVKADAALICEPDTFIASDRVVLPGHSEPFQVDGMPQNYDHNPWWSPGRDFLLLKRVTG